MIFRDVEISLDFNDETISKRYKFFNFLNKNFMVPFQFDKLVLIKTDEQCWYYCQLIANIDFSRVDNAFIYTEI